jgi:UDP-glucose 4-epimerase
LFSGSVFIARNKAKMARRKCCVIGGAGFIGQYLIRLLLNTERDLIVIDLNKTPPHSFLNHVEYICGDYGNSDLLKQILKNVDEIILLAHTTVPQTSYDNPMKDLLDNVLSAVNLFKIASNFKVKKVVFISSGGTVYGKAKQLPITEEHPTNPISPYGISKLTIEKYALMYNVFKKLPVVCLRPGNAYGEGQRPFTGQGFISTAISSILQNKEVLLFGESGTIRDYIHVQDLATGIVAALEKGVPGEGYNLGTGVGRNNLQILNSLRPIARPAGYDILVRIEPPRIFDVPVNILDSTKIREHTGWQPFINFDEPLHMTWNWFLERKDSIL